MSAPVTLYKTQERFLRVQDGYDLNAHGRFAWLHRILWRLLKRWGAVAPSMRDEITTIRLPISADSIFQRILESYRDRFSNYCKPTEVLIGPSTLSELINCPEVRDHNSPFSFTAEAGFNRSIYGLPIRVIPQMEGVVVLDDRSRA